VGIVVGVPVAVMFFFLLRATGWYWWFYFGFFLFFVSVFLARVAPVLIFPLFYTFREIDSEEVRESIMALMKGQGIDVKGIYSFNLSKNTKKANAGFTGLGRSRRIILSDTLMERFSPAEIAVVFAHELGHYRMGHIVKSILAGTASIFISFYLCGELYRLTLGWLGYVHPWEIAALPVLFFYLTLFSLVTMPASNALSRKFEREADRYALEKTGDRDSFVSAMEKLAELNLADRDPNPVTEFMFYSHPSIKKRIAFARSHAL
jgi:STE24 endopeptidase